jgi:cell wall-associated NlpC family hydrolase
MNLKKIAYLAVCIAVFCVIFAGAASAQKRDRIVKSDSSRPVNQPPAAAPAPDRSRTLNSSQPINRPALTSNIVVVGAGQNPNLVRKTVSDKPLISAATASSAGSRSLVYSQALNRDLLIGIQNRLGIPYLYGSTGPNRYDCSGFVWSVFNDAGVFFERASARSLWNSSEPVYGDDRFKFGTLVFLNGLGHMGIVADENGFYHASSSKGITYSPFKGYWEKRVVGFRRAPSSGMTR